MRVYRTDIHHPPWPLQPAQAEIGVGIVGRDIARRHDDEARETYPDGWVSPRPYIRIVPQPS